MPCNDPAVYIDRCMNQYKGRGYIDSKTFEEFDENLLAYDHYPERGEMAAKDLALSLPDKLNLRTAQLCELLGKMEELDVIKFAPEGIRAWWEWHQLFDKHKPK